MKYLFQKTDKVLIGQGYYNKKTYLIEFFINILIDQFDKNYI